MLSRRALELRRTSRLDGALVDSTVALFCRLVAMYPYLWRGILCESESMSGIDRTLGIFPRRTRLQPKCSTKSRITLPRAVSLLVPTIGSQHSNLSLNGYEEETEQDPDQGRFSMVWSYRRATGTRQRSPLLQYQVPSLATQSKVPKPSQRQDWRIQLHRKFQLQSPSQSRLQLRKSRLSTLSQVRGTPTTCRRAIETWERYLKDFQRTKNLRTGPKHLYRIRK